MATNGGFETNGDVEARDSTGPNEVNGNHAADHARNQTKEVLELSYRNSKHSAICSIVVFLALILLLGAILFVLIFFLDGPGSSQPEIEMQVEVKGQYVVAVSARIQNLDFKESLLDRNSKEYTDLEDQVKSRVSSAIADTDLKDKYAGLEINNIRSGSVIVDFVIIFCDPFMTEDDILQTVEDALKTVNSNNATKDNLQIDNSQLSVGAASGDHKLRGIFCEPLRPTIISPSETPSVSPTAEDSSYVSPTPTSSQITHTMSSDFISPTPSSQTTTPTVSPTLSSSFVTTEVPSTSTSVSQSTTKVSSTTPLMSSTFIKTSGFTTTPSFTTALSSTSIQLITTPFMTTSITSTASSELLTSAVTPSSSTSVGISSTPSSILTSTSSILLSTTMPVSVFPTASSSHDVSMTSSLPISSQPPTSMSSKSSASVSTSSIQPTATISQTSTMTSVPVIPPQSSTPELPSVTRTTITTYSTGVQSQPMTPGPNPSLTASSMLSVSVSQISPSVAPTSIPFASSTLTSMTRPSLASTTIDLKPTSSLFVSSQVLSSSFTTMSSISSAVSLPLSQTSTPVVSMTTPLVPSFSSSIVTPSPTSASPATSQSTFFSQGTSTIQQTSTSVILSTPLPSTTTQSMVTTMKPETTEEVTSSPPTSPPVDTTITLTESSSLSPSVSTYQSSTEESTTSPVQTKSTVPFISTTPSIKTTAGPSTGNIPTQMTSLATVPLTVCAESSRFFNPSIFFNSSVALDGTPVNFQCSWTYIVAIQDARIQVHFLTFDLGNDMLEVDISDSRTVTYSGSTVPNELTTDSHMVRFTLKTDSQPNPIKFSIFLLMVLPENLVTAPMLNETTPIAGTTTLPGCPSRSAQLLASGPPKTITSPGYPRGYLTNLECTWQFISLGQNQESIFLEFVAFDLGDDILEISSSDNGVANRRLTGSQLPGPISTTSSQLELKFISDMADTAKGFEVSIRLLEPTTTCLPSHMFVNSEQSPTVTSPGFPIGYGANLVCSWTLQSTQPNTHIIITFLNFDLGDDLLQVIFQGNVMQFSGSLLPMPITIANDRVELQFTSNGQNENPGFELEVSVQLPIVTTPMATEVMTSATQPNNIPVVHDLTCTSSSVLLTATSDPKTFTSPGYPSHNYNNESSCTWSFILVDNIKVLRLHFISFDVGNDIVRVDYGASTSKNLAGSNLPEDITTVGNMLSVELSTSEQSNYPGFEAVVTVVDR